MVADPDTLRRRLVQMPAAHPLDKTGMRDCQIEAITGLEKSFAEDRLRALIHMAAGAGKTYTACAFTHRLIKYAKARRVLFLVDRSNLGEQARDEFHRFRTPDTGRLFTEPYLAVADNSGIARTSGCGVFGLRFSFGTQIFGFLGRHG